MDLLTAVRTRRSSRAFLPDSVAESDIVTIIEAAIAAPSPLNAQPWNFVVVTNADVKAQIAAEAARYKAELREKSNWKWLDKFSLDFLGVVPVMIAVFGNPRRSGADIIMEGTAGAWRDACGAAIQNMMLAASSIGLSTLWFTMFEKTTLKSILGVEGDAVPLTIVMVGKPTAPVVSPPRKSVGEVTRFLR
jgi:nitroreductase